MQGKSYRCLLHWIARDRRKHIGLHLEKLQAYWLEKPERISGRIVKNPNARNRWNGKTFSSGIKSKVNKEATEGKVHIMGDFRLKFFEMGTKTRYKKRTKGRPSTGSIKPLISLKKPEKPKNQKSVIV